MLDFPSFSTIHSDQLRRSRMMPGWGQAAATGPGCNQDGVKMQSLWTLQCRIGPKIGPYCCPICTGDVELTQHFQILPTFSDSPNIFRFSQHFQIIPTFSDFSNIFRFSQHFQIFPTFSDVPNIFRFF